MDVAPGLGNESPTIAKMQAVHRFKSKVDIYLWTSWRCIATLVARNDEIPLGRREILRSLTIQPSFIKPHPGIKRAYDKTS